MPSGGNISNTSSTHQNILKMDKERILHLVGKNFDQWTQPYQLDEVDEDFYPLPRSEREAVVEEERRRMY